MIALANLPKLEENLLLTSVGKISTIYRRWKTLKTITWKTAGPADTKASVSFLWFSSRRQTKQESQYLHQSLYNLEVLCWCLVLGVFLLRFMTLGSKINKKYRNLSVLITEQVPFAPPLTNRDSLFRNCYHHCLYKSLKTYCSGERQENDSTMY